MVFYQPLSCDDLDLFATKINSASTYIYKVNNTIADLLKTFGWISKRFIEKI